MDEKYLVLKKDKCPKGMNIQLTLDLLLPVIKYIII